MNKQVAAGFLKYEYHLRSFLWNRLRNHAETEDLMQEVALVVLQKSFTGSEEKLRSWLFEVARRILLDYLKKSRRRRTFSLPGDEMSELISRVAVEHPRNPERSVQENRALYECLESMGGERVRLLRLRFFEALPFGEMAAMYGRSAPSIRKSVYRAQEALLACIRRRLSESAGGAQ